MNTNFNVCAASLPIAVLVFALVLIAPPGRAQTAPSPAEQATIVRAADRVYIRELARLRKTNALAIDERTLDRVRRAADPLIKRAQEARPESRQWQWAINVELRAEPVLYCLPGGRMMISTGFLDTLRPTPGELSALLAHAIAHALEGHDGDEAAAQFAQRREPGDADPNRGELKLGDLMLKLTLSEPQLPEAERAADSLALELLARSAEDPRSALSAWRKVAAVARPSPPAFPALHPATQLRIDAMQTAMPAMVLLYETALREQAPAPPTGNERKGNAPAGDKVRRPPG